MEKFRMWKLLVPVAIVFSVGCTDKGDADTDVTGDSTNTEAVTGVPETATTTTSDVPSSGAGTGTGGTE
ncbi:MAG TPA: hypothetical protein VFF75_10540 [Methylophilaceae bacterium]|nr:hypothetical protein [Methylophilaceae bacterium]